MLLRLSVAAAALLSLAGGASTASDARATACAQPRAGGAYTARVMRALRATQDVWGNELLAARDGPTYAGARRYLAPLLYARAAGKSALTPSGVYYLPFGQPDGAKGAGSVNLHVADGGSVIADRIGGRTLTIAVGGERFGSCLARLAPARLADGWLPILQTRYGRYEQESFSAHVGATLQAFVHVSPGGRFNGVRAEYVTWSGGTPRRIDRAGYAAARGSVVDYWTRRLDEGARIDVPEKRVEDAVRAVLVQNLAQTFRYSIGNAYEQFSFPESVDVAQVMNEYGHRLVARSILRTSLTRKATPYPQWKQGEKLLGWAAYARLTGDDASLRQATPTLRAYVARLQAAMTPRGLLRRERYSSDIPDQVYGLHAQAVVWQGLNAIAAAWSTIGLRADAGRARSLASRLERGLRRALAASKRRLPDGSLFVPVRLLDHERPYVSVTESRAGSYWNLVAPYALASGLLTDAQERGALRYLLRHGSRLLGLVRAGAYALYRNPIHPVSGTDQVYGINVARFLANVDEPEQLVLSLYGTLAAAMTPETFVAGEAASVSPLDANAYRAMYLPPNGAGNAALLETVRSLLVHETAQGLELAFATPRPWLRPGKRVAVERMPTSFGPVGYVLDAGPASVTGTVELPPRATDVHIRVRLPHGTRVTRVTIDGAIAPAQETIELSGRSGSVEFIVGYRAESP